MPINWTPELDKKLLLTCIEQYKMGPKWAEIAVILGPSFSIEAVRQRFAGMKRAHKESTAGAAGDAGKVSKEKGDPNPAKANGAQSKTDNVRAKKRKYKNVDDDEAEYPNETADPTLMKTPSRAAEPPSKRARSVRYSVPDVEEDGDDE